MKVLLALSVLLMLSSGGLSGSSEPTRRSSQERTPVMVELFTSEGCSSCPPADALLADFDRLQPVPGAELVVLSEHVDYWNDIGWRDPYSSRFYTDRQGAYASRFGLRTVYTPQMVVDGNREFVGNSAKQAHEALVNALNSPKINLQFSALSVNQNTLRAHLNSDVLPPSFGVPEAEVYVAVSLNRAESQVARGENAGRKLSHSSVVRSLIRVAKLRAGESVSRDIQVRLDKDIDLNNMRLIGFVQEPGLRRVIAAQMQFVGK